MVALLAFTACYNDDGNYNYLTEEEVGVIQFDTTGLSAELSTLSYGLEPNEHINVHVNVKYPGSISPLPTFSISPFRMATHLFIPRATPYHTNRCSTGHAI